MKRLTILLLFLISLLLAGCMDGAQRSKLDENESEGKYSRNNNSIFCEDSKMKEVDIDSFVVFKDSNYAKDKKNVYFPIDVAYPNCPEPPCGAKCFKYVISEADPKTFKVLKDNYAKDKNNIYYNGKKVKGADLKTFEVLEDGYAKDKNNIYKNGEIQEDKDPETFEVDK